jgi:hypothetical protein
MLQRLGASLVKSKRFPTENSTTLDSIIKGLYCNVVKEFGIDNTGKEDVTVPLQNAIDKCSTLGYRPYIPKGKYKITPSLGTELDVTLYDYGENTLMAGIVIPYELGIVTDGTDTEFCFYDLRSGTDVGVAISVPSTEYSQKTCVFGGFMVRAMGSTGKFGVVLPANENVWLKARPKYIFTTPIHYCGSTDEKTVLYNPPEGWEVGFQAGDLYKLDGLITGHGTYLPTMSPSGQHQMTGFSCRAKRGAFGINVKMVMNCCFTGYFLGDEVEGFSLTDSEIWNCYRSVWIKSSKADPGGFIDNVHANAVAECYRVEGRPYLHIGNIEAYRADSYYTDGVTPWFGLRLIKSMVDVASITAIQGSSFTTEQNCAAVHADAESNINVVNAFVQAVYKGIEFSGATRSSCDKMVTNAVDRCFVLSKNARFIRLGEVLPKAALPKYYFVKDDTVDTRYITAPRETGLQLGKWYEKTYSTDEVTLVRPRMDASKRRVIMGVGTYSAYVDLDVVSAVDGDEVELHIITSSNNASSVTVRSGKEGSTLSVFSTPSSASTRYYAKYIYSATANAWREMCMQSVDNLV